VALIEVLYWHLPGGTGSLKNMASTASDLAKIEDS